MSDDRILKLQGQRLKMLRNNKHYTQAKLSEIINPEKPITPEYVSAWESGKRSFKRHAERLAEIFGVTVDYILCKTNYYPYKTPDDFRKKTVDPDLVFLDFIKTYYGMNISFLCIDITMAVPPGDPNSFYINSKESSSMNVSLTDIENLSFNYAVADLKDDKGSVWIKEVLVTYQNNEIVNMPYYIFCHSMEQIRDDILSNILTTQKRFESLLHVKQNMYGAIENDPLFDGFRNRIKLIEDSINNEWNLNEMEPQRF